jgi:peroxin-19
MKSVYWSTAIESEQRTNRSFTFLFFSFDDLDDVLDDFSGGSSLTTAAASIPPAPTKPAPALPVAGNVDDEFPDPDDELLEGEDFSKLVSEGMAGIMNGLGPDEEAEFKTLMAEMMKGGGAEEGDFDPASFLAALGGDSSMFGGDAAGPSKATSASKGKSKAKASSKPAPAVNFQDTIASAMNKLKDSSTTLDAESEAKATAGGDPLAAMMAQMAGLGDMGGEEGLQGMLDEVMDQLMSRELLYEPLKELSDKVNFLILDRRLLAH